MNLFWAAVLVRSAELMFLYEVADLFGIAVRARRAKRRFRDEIRGYWYRYLISSLRWCAVWSFAWGILNVVWFHNMVLAYACFLTGLVYLGIWIWRWWNTKGKGKLAAKVAGYKHVARLARMGVQGAAS